MTHRLENTKVADRVVVMERAASPNRAGTTNSCARAARSPNSSASPGPVAAMDEHRSPSERPRTPASCPRTQVADPRTRVADPRTRVGDPRARVA
ncbi:hypothetical protein NKH77_09735 [Streptomyces sp. M19]